ncbi:unnamed protein product [Ilex paraguariensis]|uniref:Calponin-homology (CH) domain-containing protein n=1 Tax=Ilex paraguariensis TaxID=185542 RepID=A0ABC8T3J6_9AQUA
MSQEIDFEGFLRAYLNLQALATTKLGSSKNSSSFLKTTTTTLVHTVSESEKASYVSQINSYLRDDPFLKQFLPIDPATNALFDLAKDGVLLCKLINVAVLNTIDERAMNTKRVLNPWERNENRTLCLNSAKATGSTVVNIGTQDLVEGRPHLVLGLISQIIKIQLLADLNLRKTPQLVELVEESNDVEELMGLAPEKVLLKWMNFHLKKAGYKKPITNFSSDLKDGEAYAYLLNVLAPEHCSPANLNAKDPNERANLVLEHAEKMDCKRYLTPKDIVEGSPNLNLAFVAQIFHQWNGLSADSSKISFADMMTDDEQISGEERCFRLWINSLGIASYVNNLFEDLGSSLKAEHVLHVCNGVIFNAFLWQLMRFNMLQLLKNLRSRFQGKEIADTDILNWANKKVKSTGRTTQIESFKDKNLSSGLFLLGLLSAVEPRVVNWNLVTKGESDMIICHCEIFYGSNKLQFDEEKKLNATYIISVARKLGCSIFLLPEDIMQVNQKMILSLTASIMYWSLQQPVEEPESSLSPATTVASPDASPTPSINGEYENFLCPSPAAAAAAAASPGASQEPSMNGGDEKSMVGESSPGGEFLNLTIDDVDSGTTVSSEVENKDAPEQIE